MIPIFRPKLKKKKGNWGIDKISAVNEPAIMIDGVKFSKEIKEEKFSFIEDQRLMIGPILIPGQKIYRKDKKTGKEYYIEFDKETIKESAHRFLRYEKTNNVNLEHEKDTNKAYFVESWIVEDKENDKAAAFNFNLLDGTWMGVMKFESPTLWEEAKQGKYNGFSVEFSGDNYDYEEVGETDVKEYTFFSKEENKEESIEEFVKPAANETEEEFIGRCVPLLINEGKDQEQATAVCYSYWDEEQMNKEVSLESLDTLMKVINRKLKNELKNITKE